MGEFSASWLALREPADVRARSAVLTDDLLQRLLGRSPVFRAVDLGTGTGSNVRYLVPRIRGPQEWVVIDDDATLLDAFSAGMHAWAAGRQLRVRVQDDGLTIAGDATVCRVAVRRGNLATLFDTPAADGAVFPRGSLVSGSALLDLVSPRWIDQLADACRAAEASALFALTYDGALSFTPQVDEDDRVRALVNVHQRSDKGFGPALGPLAAAYAETAFGQRGYQTQCAASAWRIGPDEAPLQRALVDGWAAAAVAMAHDEAPRVARWRRERSALIDEGRSTLFVGHQDVAAWLG